MREGSYVGNAVHPKMVNVPPGICFFRMALAGICVEYIPSVCHRSQKTEVGLYGRIMYTPCLFLFYFSEP